MTEAGEQERALLRQIEDLEGGGATLDRRLKEVHASLKETEGALNDKQTETIRLMGVVSTCEQQIKSLGNDLQESRDAGETLTGKLAGSSEEAVELRSLLSVEREERAEDARIAAAAAKDLTDLRAQLEAATQQHAATSKHLERSGEAVTEGERTHAALLERVKEAETARDDLTARREEDASKARSMDGQLKASKAAVAALMEAVEGPEGDLGAVRRERSALQLAKTAAEDEGKNVRIVLYVYVYVYV